MSWEQILKKRQFASVYFQHLKTTLLELVEEMPSGTKFRTIDLKDKFLQALEKPRTKENMNFHRGLAAFGKNRIERWLNATGARLINTSGLVEEGREKVKGMIRKGKKMSSHAKKIIDEIMDDGEKSLEDVLELVQQDIEERGKESLDNLTGKQSVPTRDELQYYLSRNYARRNTKINDEFGSRRITYYYKE